jgi:hypothetical protein
LEFDEKIIVRQFGEVDESQDSVAVWTQNILIGIFPLIEKEKNFLFINFCVMDVWIFCCECHSYAFEL